MYCSSFFGAYTGLYNPLCKKAWWATYYSKNYSPTQNDIVHESHSISSIWRPHSRRWTIRVWSSSLQPVESITFIRDHWPFLTSELTTIPEKKWNKNDPLLFFFLFLLLSIGWPQFAQRRLELERSWESKNDFFFKPQSLIQLNENLPWRKKKEWVHDRKKSANIWWSFCPYSLGHGLPLSSRKRGFRKNVQWAWLFFRVMTFAITK